jgi:hypothetical protein
VEQWRARYPDLPDLESKMVRLGSVILARGHCHAGWSCPEGWMAGCLGEDNAKARAARSARQPPACDPARTAEFYAMFAELRA